MNLSAIMIYTNNLNNVIPFWCDLLDFSLINIADEGIQTITISVNENTRINFFDKETIRSMNTGVNLETPSLMFQTKDINTLHKHLISHDITVGEITNHNGLNTFNFSDLDGNYFAIQEIK